MSKSLPPHPHEGESLGCWLRRLRSEQELTLKAVAEATAMDLTQVQKIERGERLPTSEQLARLTEYFGLDPEEAQARRIAQKFAQDHGHDPAAAAAVAMLAEEPATYGSRATAPGRKVTPNAAGARQVASELGCRSFALREKLILCGLFLARFDVAGVKRLGFETFTEAFNALGYSLSSRPASIKNYRDEFDPHFPNPRQGWRKRETRPYCLAILDEFKDLPFEQFGRLIRSLVDSSELDPFVAPEGGEETETSSFGSRLITGLAAENYFETNYPTVADFRGYDAERMTLSGCGFDFRLRSRGREGFLAVEVKGLSGPCGGILLTSKEHRVASMLGPNYFLFVVSNFREVPMHRIFPNPLLGPLEFERRERQLIETNWITRISRPF